MLKIKVIEGLADGFEDTFEQEIAKALKEGWTPKYSSFKVLPETHSQDKAYAILVTKEE